MKPLQKDPEMRSARPNPGPGAAARNRHALIDAARLEFSEQGATVPLSKIARRAEVGQGTLYRHFSDRVDLATAVFEQNIHLLKRAAQADRPYTEFMNSLEKQAGEASVMVEIVSSREALGRSAVLRGRLRELVTEVHAAARDAGELSSKATAEELLTASSMFALAVAKAPAEMRAETVNGARRMLDAWFLREPGTISF